MFYKTDEKSASFANQNKNFNFEIVLRIWKEKKKQRKKIVYENVKKKYVLSGWVHRMKMNFHTKERERKKERKFRVHRTAYRIKCLRSMLLYTRQI